MPGHGVLLLSLPIHFWFDFSSPCSYIVNDWIDAVAARHMFGAPWVVVDGEPSWGNDRKAQIERWLSQGPFQGLSNRRAGPRRRVVNFDDTTAAARRVSIAGQRRSRSIDGRRSAATAQRNPAQAQEAP